MGIAVLSGVIASLDSPLARTIHPKWESHTPGTTTPIGPPDASLPTRFIACVSREESAGKLRTIFGSLGALGETVEVVASQNLKAVKQADVVLLWCVTLHFFKFSLT
jgi:pyrroline-5-carboxylate reductase